LTNLSFFKGTTMFRRTALELAFKMAMVLVLLSTALTAFSGELNDAAFVELTKNLQTKLDSLRKEQGFPGATAAVAFENGRLIKLATGMANVEKGIAMTPLLLLACTLKSAAMDSCLTPTVLARILF
jgi:hypothetical protein